MRTVRLAGIALLTCLLACGGGGDDDDVDSAITSFCGDTSCSGAENCTNCPGDCGVCPCDPAETNSCTGEEICVGTTCVSAWGRTYTFSVFELTVAYLDPYGDAWDVAGGAPDPFVKLFLGGSLILTTAEVSDDHTPTFYDSADAVIAAGATLRMEAWDSDLTDDDWIIGCEGTITAAHLRYVGMICEGTGTSDGTTLDILIVRK